MCCRGRFRSTTDLECVTNREFSFRSDVALQGMAGKEMIRAREFSSFQGGTVVRDAWEAICRHDAWHAHHRGHSFWDLERLDRLRRHHLDAHRECHSPR